MKNFAQLTFDFNQREKAKAKEIGDTQYKAFEINYSVPTNIGFEEKQMFVKAQNPKASLTTFRQRMSEQGQEFYEVNEVVSPNKTKGNVVYKVYMNRFILR